MLPIPIDYNHFSGLKKKNYELLMNNDGLTELKEDIYRIEGSKKIVNVGARSKHAIERNGGGEAEIQRRRAGRGHVEGILDVHEEEERDEEGARYGVSPHHTKYIPHPPLQEKRASQTTASMFSQLRGCPLLLLLLRTARPFAGEFDGVDV